MSYRFSSLAVLVFAVVFIMPATAQNGEQFIKGRLFPPKLVMEHRAQLDLSATQSEAIKKEIHDMQAKALDIQWDMQQLGDELNQQLDANPVDEKAVMQAVDQFLDAENRMKRAQLTMLIRIRNVLNNEQIEYLKSVVSAARPGVGVN